MKGQQSSHDRFSTTASKPYRQETFSAMLATFRNSGIREACIQASGILRKPRRFLVAALTETVRPTHISEGEQRQIKSPVDIGGITNAYSQTKWIVYTRGDYALALPSAPQADAQNVPQLPAQDAVNVDPTPQSPAMGSPSTSLRIVFRKIEKEWKIDRLLQTTALTPTVGTLPPPKETSHRLKSTHLNHVVFRCQTRPPSQFRPRQNPADILVVEPILAIGTANVYGAVIIACLTLARRRGYRLQPFVGLNQSCHSAMSRA